MIDGSPGQDTFVLLPAGSRQALVCPPGDQYPFEPDQPVGGHLAGELAGEFDLALVPELPGNQFARPMAYPMGDVVVNLAVVGDAQYDDVNMRMAGLIAIQSSRVSWSCSTCRLKSRV